MELNNLILTSVAGKLGLAMSHGRLCRTQGEFSHSITPDSQNE